jgi:hypothetical protein
MPIRLNLLAEAQTAEDLRRRDPVKRGLWIGGLLAALMLIWSAGLQMKVALVKGKLTKVTDVMKAKTNDFREVQDGQKKVNEMKFKLEHLDRLAATRFLNGTLMNALQQSMVEDVQLIHARAEESYTYIEGTKNRTNENRVIPGRPATWTEKIVITLDGSDSSANPGDQVIKYRDAVASHSYFQGILGRTNQVNLKGSQQSPPSPENAKASMLFTLECRLPEKTR